MTSVSATGNTSPCDQLIIPPRGCFGKGKYLIIKYIKKETELSIATTLFETALPNPNGVKGALKINKSV